MKTKSVVAVATAGLLALSLSACGGSSAPSAGGGTKNVAIIAKGFQFAYWQAVKKGAEQEAAKEGVNITFNGPPTEQDVAQQVTMVQNALATNPNVLALAALDSNAVAPLLTQAQQQKIPVIGFDSGVKSDVPVSTAATDNTAAAAEAAKHMAQLVGNSGKVAIVGFDQTSENGKQRVQGFIDWMKQNAPNITVLTPQYGGGDLGKSADIAKNFITSNPDLKGIYGANEGSAEGVIQGVTEAGKAGKITIIGFDSGKAQTDAIRSGVAAGAITQNPIGIGEEVVKAAVKAMNGETLPKSIDTGFYFYDKSNIDDPKIAALLYQ